MRCPYCGAEVVGRKCIFCSSDLIEHIKKNGLEVDDFKEETKSAKEDQEVKEEKEEKKKEKKKDKKNHSDKNSAIRDLCAEVREAFPDITGSYDMNRNLIAGKGVKPLLFEILQIPDGEEVFLIHDDTLMGSGKNGFAITDHGFYCKELWEDLSIISFTSLDSDDEAVKGKCNIYLNEEKRRVAYMSGNAKGLERLYTLYNDILDVIFE